MPDLLGEQLVQPLAILEVLLPESVVRSEGPPSLAHETEELGLRVPGLGIKSRSRQVRGEAQADPRLVRVGFSRLPLSVARENGRTRRTPPQASAVVACSRISSSVNACPACS